MQGDCGIVGHSSYAGRVRAACSYWLRQVKFSFVRFTSNEPPRVVPSEQTAAISSAGSLRAQLPGLKKTF